MMSKSPTVFIDKINDQTVSITVHTEGHDAKLEISLPEPSQNGEALDDRTRRGIVSLMDTLDAWMLTGSSFTRRR